MQSLSDKTKKIILIGSSVFILCMCCGGLAVWIGSRVNRALVTDPAELAALGQEIATYTLPEGYQEFGGIRFLNGKSIFIANLRNPTTTIFLMQVPNNPGLTQAETERELRSIMQRFNFQPLELTFDRVETRIVNGEEVRVTFRSGSDRNETPYLQMTAFFRSDQGPAFLMVQGLEEGWDQELLDRFMESLR